MEPTNRGWQKKTAFAVSKIPLLAMHGQALRKCIREKNTYTWRNKHYHLVTIRPMVDVNGDHLVAIRQIDNCDVRTPRHNSKYEYEVNDALHYGST